MDPSRVYFTWPDGLFRYDCRGCGDCCKGLGIGLDATAGQVDRLVGLYPGMVPFLRKRGQTWTAFNPRGRCWFLDDAGLCRIEIDHGRDTKPASCRLFPFNRIFRLGSWTIVDFNSVICPLQAAPAPDAGTGEPPGAGGAVSHASVLAEIAAVRDAAIVGTPLPAEHPEEEGQRFVARERAIAAACFAAAAAPGMDAVARVWQAQGGEGALERALAPMGRALALLTGAPWRSPDHGTLASCLWLTPSLRFNELYGSRQYGPRAELAGVLAGAWLAWLHACALGADMAGRSLDLRAATSLWAETMPLAHLVARWQAAPTMAPGPVELPGAEDTRGVVRRLAEACVANRARAPLGSLLAPLLDDVPAAERAVLARLVEPLLPRIRWRRARAQSP
jgi:Fe-S-cluster containining protein